MRPGRPNQLRDSPTYDTTWQAERSGWGKRARAHQPMCKWGRSKFLERAPGVSFRQQGWCLGGEEFRREVLAAADPWADPHDARKELSQSALPKAERMERRSWHGCAEAGRNWSGNGLVGPYAQKSRKIVGIAGFPGRKATPAWTSVWPKPVVVNWQNRSITEWPTGRTRCRWPGQLE